MKIKTGKMGALIGIVFTAACLYLLVAEVGPQAIMFQTIFLFCILIGVFGTIDSFARYMELTDQGLVCRGALFRRTLIPYAMVRQIAFYRTLVLTVTSDDGVVLQMSSKTPGIEAFIQSLSERVTAQRSLDIVGDLKPVQPD